MPSLCDQIERTLLPGMHVPHPLKLMFAWIEDNKMFIDRDGRRIGFLYPDDKYKAEWTDIERSGGTAIDFFAEGNASLESWFGHNRAEVLSRVCVFAKTGCEGSKAAFWIDDEGKQRIVHLGSGSGSTMVCILASEPLDFLRLLAIGYDEICWNEAFSKPPNFDHVARRSFVHPNVEFQNWVRTIFAVTIPETAAEIVRHPSEMGDSSSADPFWRWVKENNG